MYGRFIAVGMITHAVIVFGYNKYSVVTAGKK